MKVEERGDAVLTRAAYVGLFLLSAATLTYEVMLTRLFSVTQFHHFAFMIVSLAMLGSGASGTYLALRLRRAGPTVDATAPSWLAAAAGATTISAYALIRFAPFDAFSMAWDVRQMGLLALHYVGLALPFFCSGAVVSLLLARHSHVIGPLYAVNLSGSAVGCVLALLLPGLVRGEGVIFACAALCALSAVALLPRLRHPLTLPALACALGCAFVARQVPSGLALRLSPYKDLSYALQLPDARLLSSRWSGASRVDLVASSAIRSLPGLSYRYLGELPPQLGLFVDGDDLAPVIPVDEVGHAGAATSHLPSAAAYALRPGGRALVLAPRGGLEAWVALEQGAREVTVVEGNRLVVEAAGALYNDPRVTVIVDDARSSVMGARDDGYDVVVLALTSSYRPVRSGAYSLGEDYAYTAEAFTDYLGQLRPTGLLVVSRWLQMPPSESLRAFALAVTAVEQLGGDPAAQIVAFRGYAMMTLLVSRAPFTAEELSTVRAFAEARAYDLVWAPGITAAEVNRYNRLPEPLYFTAFRELITSDDRAAWIADYPFDVRPPTDDRPFFAHTFRWAQTPQVLAELGKSWQPFGGAGYLVVVALLLLSAVAAALLIGLPLLARAGVPAGRGMGWELLYFACLGLAFLCVEIPLMQRAILFLGQPAYAVTVVLAALLLSSGMGSYLSARLPPRVRIEALIGLLVGVTALTALLLPRAFAALLGLPWGWRVVATGLLPAPLGLLMGMPFPLGLRALARRAPERIPWAWAANGALSVVAAVLAALLSLSFGFTVVLVVGAAGYTVAAVAAHRALG